MRVIITGVTGFRNRGVDALVTTTIEQLNVINKQINIIVQTKTPEYDCEKLKVFKNVTTFGYPSNLKDKVRDKFSSFHHKFAFDYNLIKNSRLLIASGGDLFTSDYSGSLEFYLKPLKLALKLNVPIVFLGQSIYFNTEKKENAFLDVAQNAKLITVRENISYRYLVEKLGLSTKIVKQTADSAFLLKIPSSKTINNLLLSYGCRQEKPLVVICPSEAITKYRNIDIKSHFKAWTQVIDVILNKLDAQVLIIPHSQYPEGDDRIIGSNLHQFFDYDSRIHFAGIDHTASEFKGLISHANFVISERMHSAIAGLSTCIPTLVIGYSVKAEGIISDLLEKKLPEKEMLIDINDFVKPGLASQQLLIAWQRQHEVKTELQKVFPQMQDKARGNFELIKKLFA
ncbi:MULTISPECIES: polysaccharide pyruvyl transferase family protein [Cyanophyceae]|uniref:polysaccharide pyruvyl transferase family protein n=1 Tax=Cyanophyceae TaxID=3028117 RepID=UPI00232CBC81|nr:MULTISPECIES: polysaccharide pyruvyl transferase family protein [Cyanophyceae]MDB9357230.1 polysaccharide pyruvyl transferase family protein [Nodularia spumigena CS-587/03]MDB9318088.1 polysaccharide pyruvyl transferase family protein [Nodularia spumigena CS-590/01A]MDB9323334.1 polysaccharide pyruvyl transferase family protein [Nodularia spumigena CS-591/07A]MDB9326860.1 polysaccharide pyruvyl transferase family protein [Nodularia spumigena CS-590/02]MDB9330738.1 polysaccharide pyruvyl tra